MGPVSTATIAKSATITASGSSLTILGNMAGLTGADWALVIFCVFGSVFGGSFALQGEVDAKHGHDSPEAIKARKLAVSMFAAQFALGMAAAAYLDGNPWRIIPACLIIGMSGPIGLSALKRLVSIGGGK